MPDAIDRWILRLIRAAYQIGYDDAEQGEGRRAFYCRRGPYDDPKAAHDDGEERELLRELEGITRGQAPSRLTRHP